MLENTIKACLECNQPIRGRSDKRFCDDACRNSYNNRQNSDQTNLIRQINHTLRKNRRMLQEALGEEGMLKVNREKLLKQGFDIKYHTHTFANVKGQTYYFIYEYGYLLLENDLLLIVKREPK
ncbi:hypothetical protein LZQ00_14610 [Sphingobacterium sp. SRCM116780]|uniref:hypothetical protein n=1 Tax=Sphingobacterium sp. SRCM116780 TaxID=2907623 RepID=UPI001F308759|nr:hypothetical protein [Sphingobacterium sp. SRCM116780]UIR55491.1 hypothetical protein LZQ00_14610 [Sphingobacterium sp. SRCM116780]